MTRLSALYMSVFILAFALVPWICTEAALDNTSQYLGDGQPAFWGVPMSAD